MQFGKLYFAYDSANSFESENEKKNRNLFLNNLKISFFFFPLMTRNV